MLLHHCWGGPQRLALARFNPRDIISLYHGQHLKSKRHVSVDSATSTEAPSADLIAWPEGLKPKRGVITRAALLKLKVSDLKQALENRGLMAAGKKEQLVEVLLTDLSTAEVSSSHGGGIINGSSSSNGGGSTVSSHSSINGHAPLASVATDASNSSSSSSSIEPLLPCNAPRTISPSPSPTATAVRGGPASTSGRYDLPPFPPGRRGNSFSIHSAGLPHEEARSMLMANTSEMMLTFLGSTSSLPSGRHTSTSIALLKAKDVLLFDAGDDTQRQLLHERHIKPSKIFRIFITARSPEKLLGLPGLLCVLSAAKVHGHESADIPIHVYGPPGLADYLATVFQVSHTYLEVAVVVHEFSQGAVPDEEQEPALFNRRAKIWRARMPPDQLNPRGYINGDLSSFMPTAGRGTVKKGRQARGGVLSVDPRAGFKPLPLPGPGDPSRSGLALHELSWTIAADEACTVTAVALPAEVPCLGYIVQEADRAGRLSTERCQALGLRPGKSFGLLKEGVSVTNDDGVVVEPADVVSSDHPGRKVAILLNTKDASSAARLAAGADVLVHDAVLSEQEAAALAASAAGAPDVGGAGAGAGAGAQVASAADAGRCAAAAGARHLLLANFNGERLAQGRAAWLRELVSEASRHFGGAVSASQEFFTLYMERHEG